jgi:hypothetical protein
MVNSFVDELLVEAGPTGANSILLGSTKLMIGDL